jgi:acyl-CoA thioester hydrolase
MKSLADFKIKVDIPIAWGDMDSFNHVNNTQFFKYFETARIRYFEEIGFIETMEKNSIGPILASTVISIEPTEFIMEYVVESKSKGIVALGESKMVVYNYKSSKRTTLPDIVRNKIREIDSI